MEINAVAYLKYRESESIIADWEGLELIVKFKEYEKKIFNTKLTKLLVSTSQIASTNSKFTFATYEEYYEKVRWILLNKEYIVKEVEELIKDHMKDKDNKIFEKSKKQEMTDAVNNMSKIRVKVKIN